MAVHADMQWEFRGASGSQSNGGGFRRDGTGTDYSDQDAAHATRTDIVIDGADDTKITSAGDNFASDDVHNVIQITSGTGFTTGFYEILSVTAGAAFLDRAVGTLSSTGGNGALGGALLKLTDAFLDNTFYPVPGNTLYVKNEAMDLSGDSITTTKDGTALAPIKLTGYNATRDDVCVEGNRPALSCGSSNFLFDNHWIIENLIVTITSSIAFRADNSSIVRNCKCTNTSGADRPAFHSGDAQTRLIDLEAISASGSAISIGGRDIHVIGCYCHDSLVGMNTNAGGDNSVIIGCAVDTCTTGLLIASAAPGLAVINNVFYNNTTGINGDDNSAMTIINNIFDANTTGLSFSTEQLNNLIDHNVWDNTSDDVIKATKGPNAIDGDPGFTDPMATPPDFTVGGGSNVLGVALQISTNTGLTGDYKVNIGIDQDDNAAGGGPVGNKTIIQNIGTY